MTRVSSQETKDRALHGFFDAFPSPSAFKVRDMLMRYAERNAEDVLRVKQRCCCSASSRGAVALARCACRGRAWALAYTIAY